MREWSEGMDGSEKGVSEGSEQGGMWEVLVRKCGWGVKEVSVDRE